MAGLNRAGTLFFGIDGQYIAQVQKKEIFALVGHGYSYESLNNMSVEERRYYYHLLVEKNAPKNDASQPLPKAAKQGNEPIKHKPF